MLTLTGVTQNTITFNLIQREVSWAGYTNVFRPLLLEPLFNYYTLRSRHHDFELFNKTNRLADDSYNTHVVQKLLLEFLL